MAGRVTCCDQRLCSAMHHVPVCHHRLQAAHGMITVQLSSAATQVLHRCELLLEVGLLRARPVSPGLRTAERVEPPSGARRAERQGSVGLIIV